jgi:hypothetical protein
VKLEGEEEARCVEISMREQVETIEQIKGNTNLGNICEYIYLSGL